MFILKYFVARPPHPYPYCLWLSSNDFLCIFFSLWYSQNVNDFLNNTLLKTIPFILIDIKIKIMKISSFNCWKKSWSNPTTTIFTSNTSSGYYSVFAQFIRSRNHWRVLWGYVKRSIEPGPLVGPGQISSQNLSSLMHWQYSSSNRLSKRKHDARRNDVRKLLWFSQQRNATFDIWTEKKVAQRSNKKFKIETTPTPTPPCVRG